MSNTGGILQPNGISLFPERMVHATCPHCGVEHKFKVEFDKSLYKQLIVYCEDDSIIDIDREDYGACNRMFVLEVEMGPITTSYPVIEEGKR